jgi:hypothetical protein
MPLTKEKKIVIKAINEMGRRVSAADVATKTGLPVALTTQTLNQIAEEASGHLQVSKAGDIAYGFPLGYQTAYISRGIKRSLEQFNNKLFEIGFFLLRISFGIMLILSLVTIVLLFFLILTAMSRGRDNDNSDGFNIDLDFFDWMILRDLMYWQISYPDYNDPRIKNKSNKSNFLYNCFSFLFGDGNPNANLKERRWHAIAQLIRQQKGVVTVEQLAPYTGEDPKNEDKMLPVLVRFDGRPTVTDSGNIVYLFPALQATASGYNFEELTSYLKVFPWQFSQADSASLAWVMVLAAINFIGSWFIYIQAINLLPSMAPLLLALIIYGSLFVGIPLIRYIVIRSLNKKIEDENIRKKQYADELAKPSAELNKKLSEARQMPLDSRQIKSDNLVYDTQKDLLEQEFHSSNNS